MRISAISTCYNEEQIMPFFIDYYSSFCDEIIFFDGNSTDRTHEIIKSNIGKTKCNIELRINHSIGTCDGYNENILEKINFDRNLSLLYIRNNAWKHLFSRDLNDWVLVVDSDEFLYHRLGLRKKLEELKEKEVTLPTVQGFNMISDFYPEFNKGNFLCEQIKSGFWSRHYSKNLVFDSKHITDMNFHPGCHNSDPTGKVVTDNDPFTDNIKLLHYKYIDFNKFINKEQAKFNHLSDINKNSGWGTHYNTNKNLSLLQWRGFRENNFFENINDATKAN